jgi:hypothetical protein
MRRRLHQIVRQRHPRSKWDAGCFVLCCVVTGPPGWAILIIILFMQALSTVGSAVSGSDGNPRPLFFAVGFAVFMALLLVYLAPRTSDDTSTIRSPILQKAKQGTESGAPMSIADKRKKALEELRVRIKDEQRLRRARIVCQQAVERDSGYKRRKSWVVGDAHLQMTFYFVVDDPRNARLFTSYSYTCDGSSGRAEITDRKIDVQIKR